MKNQEKWSGYVKINSTDAYSLACVNVARQVMKMLDEDKTPLRNGYHPDVHTAHGMICKADGDEFVKSYGGTITV